MAQVGRTKMGTRLCIKLGHPNAILQPFNIDGQDVLVCSKCGTASPMKKG